MVANLLGLEAVIGDATEFARVAPGNSAVHNVEIESQSLLSTSARLAHELEWTAVPPQSRSAQRRLHQRRGGSEPTPEAPNTRFSSTSSNAAFPGEVRQHEAEASAAPKASSTKPIPIKTKGCEAKSDKLRGKHKDGFPTKTASCKAFSEENVDALESTSAITASTAEVFHCLAKDGDKDWSYARHRGESKPGSACATVGENEDANTTDTNEGSCCIASGSSASTNSTVGQADDIIDVQDELDSWRHAPAPEKDVALLAPVTRRGVLAAAAAVGSAKRETPSIVESYSGASASLGTPDTSQADGVASPADFPHTLLLGAFGSAFGAFSSVDIDEQNLAFSAETPGTDLAAPAVPNTPPPPPPPPIHPCLTSQATVTKMKDAHARSQGQPWAWAQVVASWAKEAEVTASGAERRSAGKGFRSPASALGEPCQRREPPQLPPPGEPPASELVSSLGGAEAPEFIPYSSRVVEQSGMPASESGEETLVTTLVISGFQPDHTTETYCLEIDAWGLQGTYDFANVKASLEDSETDPDSTFICAVVNFIDPTFAMLYTCLLQEWGFQGVICPAPLQGLNANSQNLSEDAAPLVFADPVPTLWAVNAVNGMLAPLVREQLHKTKLCVFHSRNRCELGSSCQFAHSPSELQAAPALAKTKLCHSYFRHRCVDPRCKFAHGYHELRMTCWWWNAGNLCLPDLEYEVDLPEGDCAETSARASFDGWLPSVGSPSLDEIPDDVARANLDRWLPPGAEVSKTSSKEELHEHFPDDDDDDGLLQQVFDDVLRDEAPPALAAPSR